MIKVEAARHFSSMGLAYYDLAGVSRNADDAKEANIRRFKMKFATGVARFGSVKNVCFSPTKYYARKIAGRVLDAANLRRK
jgi:lipid II:glycine glycyltransferase (peptidoglycan interpeptide bridge formation enzyme)